MTRPTLFVPYFFFSLPFFAFLFGSSPGNMERGPGSEFGVACPLLRPSFLLFPSCPLNLHPSLSTTRLRTWLESTRTLPLLLPSSATVPLSLRRRTFTRPRSPSSACQSTLPPLPLVRPLSFASSSFQTGLLTDLRSRPSRLCQALLAVRRASRSGHVRSLSVAHLRPALAREGPDSFLVLQLRRHRRRPQCAQSQGAPDRASDGKGWSAQLEEGRDGRPGQEGRARGRTLEVRAPSSSIEVESTS